MNIEYPLWVCFSCAKHSKKIPMCASFHMDICCACNEWKSVTQLRDYGYPKIKYKMDNLKILKELEKAMKTYEETEDFLSASIIKHRINNLSNR